jgi:hypothetical protein
MCTLLFIFALLQLNLLVLMCFIVLALDISSDLSFAVSTGTDNVLAKYDLFSQVQGVPEVTKVALKSNGITGTKIRKDGKIIGMAGWDGR